MKQKIENTVKNNSFLFYLAKKIFFLAKYFKFIINFLLFKKLSASDRRFLNRWKDRRPYLTDNLQYTSFDSHYTYHPAWAARILEQTKPKKHTDISSILSFCVVVSAFIPTDFYDYRPAKLKLSNLNSNKADLLCLPFADNSIESLSCMHTVEHIGLGRYGEPLDPNGDIKAINELIRVLANGGNLLFVVPVGKPRIKFNAHRIYSYKQIMEYFKSLKLNEFSLIPDNAFEKGIIYNAKEKEADGQSYGCGCFWFRK